MGTNDSLTPLDLIIDDDEEGQVSEHHRMKQPESELHRIAKPARFILVSRSGKYLAAESSFTSNPSIQQRLLIKSSSSLTSPLKQAACNGRDAGSKSLHGHVAEGSQINRCSEHRLSLNRISHDHHYTCNVSSISVTKKAFFTICRHAPGTG